MIGGELDCKLQAQNKYSSRAIMVLAKQKNKKSKGKTSKKMDKVDYSWSYSRHFSKVFQFMKTWKIYLTKPIIS